MGETNSELERIFSSYQVKKNVIDRFIYLHCLECVLMKATCVLQLTSQNAKDFTPLTDQYAVTAHAPNFDFWTGCREIKTCEESTRTLKNPFA